MKTYKQYLMAAAAASLLFTAQSCDLDEYNPGGSTAEEAFKTETGYNTIINAIYAYWGGQLYGREDPVLLFNGGNDEWINIANSGYGRQLSKYEETLATTGQFKNTWVRLYEIVNDCNSAIERNDQAEFTDSKMKTIRLGEAHFMRAFAYWHIVENFGNVDLRTTETKEFSQYCYRSSYDEFYDLMLDDCDKAIEYLDVNPYPTTDVGRATKKAAYGLKARIALTRIHYCTSQSDKDKYYEIAEEAAKYVIDNQSSLNVSMYSTPAEVFAKENNKTNKEALFVVTHSTESTLNMKSSNPYRLHGYFHAKYTSWVGMVGSYEYGNDRYGKNGGMCMMPTKHLLELYNEDIDARYNAWFREEYKLNSTSDFTWDESNLAHFEKPSSMAGQTIKVGETALLFTKKQIPNKRNLPYAVVDIDDTYDPITGVVSTDANFNIHFPSLLKYEDGNLETKGLSYNSELGANDVFMMRLPEMYFIVAECEVMKSGGSTAKAADYINVIRKRAAVPGKESQMTVSASDMNLDFILDERSRELCGEHLRWFDLKRTGKLIEYVKKYNPNITNQACELRPIPQSFLDSILNPDEFGQNDFTK
jgi:hypothetical protein